MKSVIKLENYYLPEQLGKRLEEFVNYNNERYLESPNNLTPSDVYYESDKQKLEKR